MCLRTGTCGAAFSRGPGILIAGLVLVLVGSNHVHGQTRVGGEYESYAAFGFGLQPDPFAIRNRLRMRGRYATPRMMAYVALRGSHALFDPQNGGDPGPFRGRILESFVDLYFSDVDVRIGHQLVVWGQMDGVFITDIVSPLDLTEFLAQDFTDIRLAVPAIKTSYYLADWSITGLLALAGIDSPIPAVDSPWFLVPGPASSLDISVGPDNLPGIDAGEIEPGLKVSYHGSGTSVDLIYLYGYNRIPALAKSITLARNDVPGVTISPNYVRRHVIGSRLSSSFLSALILEAEVAYESVINVDLDLSGFNDLTDLAASTGDLLDRQGHVLGGVSLGRSYGQTFVRAQVIGSLLTRRNHRTTRDAFQEAATLLVRSTWRNETLGGQVFVYYSPEGGYWLNPSLSYSVAAGLNFFLGGHVFGGDSSVGALSTSAFGLFDENDLVYLRATLAF